MIEFMTLCVSHSDMERPNQSSKTSPLPSRLKALIRLPRVFSTLTESLSKVKHRFLVCKPTSFHSFSLLPRELQLLIIVLALQDREEVVIAQPYPNGAPGWWSGPHSFQSVNQIFRQQTQRSRPKAFAHVDKSLSSPAAATASPEGLVRVRSFLYYSFVTVHAPARVDFDFKRDTLAISSSLLVSTLSRADVPDLKKIDTIVISWADSFGFIRLLEFICRRYPNIKNVGLIHQGLLNYGHSKTFKGKKRYFTTSGPFHSSEIEMKEWVVSNFSYQARIDNGIQVPRVVSLRTTQNPKKRCRRS